METNYYIMDVYIVRKKCINCGYLKFSAIVKVSDSGTESRCLQCNTVTHVDMVLDREKLRQAQESFVARTKTLLYLKFMTLWEHVEWWKEGKRIQDIEEKEMVKNIDWNWKTIKKQYNDEEITDFD